MTLENLVPSLETCRKIPQGEFTDSALVWLPSEKIAHVFARDQIAVYSEKTLKMCIPAPTHEKICMDINRITGEKIVTSCFGGFWIVSVRINGDSLVVRAQNPATAALRMWMRLKGVQG